MLYVCSHTRSLYISIVSTLEVYATWLLMLNRHVLVLGFTFILLISLYLLFTMNTKLTWRKQACYTAK
jgi:hypothetical protein